jgi:hypothetical protein
VPYRRRHLEVSVRERSKNSKTGRRSITNRMSRIAGQVKATQLCPLSFPRTVRGVVDRVALRQVSIKTPIGGRHQH